MKHRKIVISLVVLFFVTACSKPCENPYVLRSKNLKRDYPCIFPDCTLGEEPLTLEEAVAIGLQQNWQLRFQKTQEQIQEEITKGETLKMLPSVTIRGEKSHRNNLYLVFNTAPSTEKMTRILEIEELWNLMEFSVAFFSYRMSLMQQCLIEQQILRARHQLILEITQSYMNCLAYYGLLEEVDNANRVINKRIEEIDEEIERKLIVASDGLDEQEKLLENLLDIQVINKKFDAAKFELLNNMGLAPSTPLILPKVELIDLVFPELDIEELESMALHYRPELFQGDIEEKISVEEVKLNIARIIPGLNFFINQNWDKNKFLVNPDWTTMGLRGSYNLLSAPNGVFGARGAYFKAVQDIEQRLYLSATIISQVNISAEQSKSILDDYLVAKRRYENRKDKLEKLQKRIHVGVGKESSRALIYGEYVKNKSLALLGLSGYITEMERLSVSVGMPLMFYSKYFKTIFSTQDSECDICFD